MYILIIIPFHLFLEDSITISITRLIIFLWISVSHTCISKSKCWLGKETYQREWCIIPFLLCCVSFPSLLPFPVKSCKKFKADEVYCWRKSYFWKKNSKKLLFCPSTQERLLNYKSSARKKQERHCLHVPYYVFYF